MHDVGAQSGIVQDVDESVNLPDSAAWNLVVGAEEVGGGASGKHVRKSYSFRETGR
jgi:hypothetical protein